MSDIENKEEVISSEPPKTEIPRIDAVVPLPKREDLVRQDNLLKGILDGNNPFDLIDIVLSEMAHECVSLKYERLKKEFKDQDTDRLSLRRANILKMINDSIVQKRSLALSDIINLKSPQWKMVFENLLLKIKKTLLDLNYSSEQLELFFQKLQSNLEGFEEEIEMKLKEITIDLD